MKLPAPAFAEAASRRQAQGGVSRITGSALTPVLESVFALPVGYPTDLPVNALAIVFK